jgi:hypothetical protein
MAKVRPPTPRFQVGQTEKGELVFPSTELIQTLEEVIQRTGGLGDVTLIGSLSAGNSTDNAVARYDGSNGDRLQTSLVTVSDTGDISVPGGATVDGRDVSGDGSKLDGIESGATADQTASEIKTLYESNGDTNAFTDSEQIKLAGIQAGAEVNAVDSVFGRTGAVAAQASDYDASQVDNDSANVAGNFVSDALDELNAPPQFHAYHTAATTLSGTTVVSLDTQVRALDVTHTAGNANVQIDNAGWYLVTFYVTTGLTNSSSIRTQTKGFLQKDTGGGYAAITGSDVFMYNRSDGQDKTTGTATILHEFASGDEVRIAAEVVSGDTTNTVLVSEACGLTLMRLTA